MHTSLSLNFIEVQSLDMFRALIAHLPAHNSHQTCVRVVSPEDGQVMPETCRDFEP
jgi:hypothetical protein